jgi:hypothetical protein
MDPSAEYRARAMRCEQLAQRANTQTRRRNLLDAALRCERIASDLEEETSAIEHWLPPPTD